MKRFISIMLIVTIFIVLVSCGNNSETSSDNSSTVKVNEGLLHNKVTIPATFFGGYI